MARKLSSKFWNSNSTRFYIFKKKLSLCGQRPGNFISTRSRARASPCVHVHSHLRILSHRSRVHFYARPFSFSDDVYEGDFPSYRTRARDVAWTAVGQKVNDRQPCKAGRSRRDSARSARRTNRALDHFASSIDRAALDDLSPTSVLTDAMADSWEIYCEIWLSEENLSNDGQT